jgi:hypothetical protein
MWMGEPATQEKVTSTWPEWLALALCCLAVVIMGIIPGAFITFTQNAVKMFGI